VMPVGGMLVERSTVPENVSKLLSVIVEAWDDPRGTAIVVGLADMLKSGATTAVATLRVLDEEPLVAVTLTT